MKAARSLLLCLLVAGVTLAGSDNIPNKKPSPQVWRTLAPFKDTGEFNHFRKRAREIARANGAWWASMRLDYQGSPLLAQAEPAAEPCDPAVQECEAAAGEELSEVSVTGMRASANASITNNQESGVDEGDIVKAFDRFIVVLYHGRLFSIDTGDAAGSLKLVDRVDAYQSPRLDSWIDEVLIFDDTLLVTGYSYETDSSNIALFRIGKDGVFSFLARYFIESEDYYSWENYATRIVDGKLVIYTPFDLTGYHAHEPVPLPRIRRWTEQAGFTPWQPLFDITEVYRPIQPAMAPSMHVVSACSIELGKELDCKSRGIVAPGYREVYVSPSHVYLWATPDEDDIAHLRPASAPDCEQGANPLRMRGWPSAVYRLTIANGELSAVFTEGTPPDQFALDEQRGSLWALVYRPPLQCEFDPEDDDSVAPLALAQVPLAAFSTRPPRMEESDHHAVPAMPVGYRHDLQSRFTDGFLLYGSAQGRGRALWRGKYGTEPYTPGALAVVRLGAPQFPRVINLSHSVDRIELFGANAVAFGYQANHDFAVSSVALDRRPRLSDTQPLPGVIESEDRSHAFNAMAQEDGSGIFGIPTMDTTNYSSSRYDDYAIDVQFITASAGLDLASADKLAGHPESEQPETNYECEVSCIDWYGNARPIFFRERIFALIGQEFVEGALSDGRVGEVGRVYLTSVPAHVRPTQQEED
jgi:hypothetical protein